MENESKNKGLIIGGVIAGVIIVTGGLMLLAGGGGYELTVLDPISGPEDAPIVIEEFSDYQCPSCRASAPIIAAAVAEFPTQVKFVYKDFPIASHSNARSAASAALCAAQQNQFKEFHDSLFESQQVWASPSVNADEHFTNIAVEHGLDIEDWNLCRNSRDARQAVQANVDEGFERGVTGTPTFYFNSEKIETPASVFAWINLIQSELEKQGITPENKNNTADSTTEQE